MKKTLLTLAVLVGALGQAPASAYALFGSPDCGKWINVQNSSQKAWLLGFMSGLSAQHEVYRQDLKDPIFKVPDPLDQVNSADQIYLWMDNFCRANPLKTVAQGGLELFAELIAKRHVNK